jgi:DNA-binding response OmpR family regulator
MDPKKANVLLIEDDKLLYDMYKIKFDIAKLRLLVAHGGYEGLSFAKREKPDLILLDIKMDDLDGFEVLKRLKADPSLKDIPVFLLTNMGEKDNTQLGLSLGAEAYIMKAKVLPSELITRVADRLNKIPR